MNGLEQDFMIKIKGGLKMKILRKVIATIISFIISCFGGDAASYTADSTFLNKLYYKKSKRNKKFK